MATSSAEVMKGYINMLLNFLIFFISRATFSYYLNFLCHRFGRVIGQGNCYIIVIIIVVVVVVVTDTPMGLTNNSVYCHYISNN